MSHEWPAWRTFTADEPGEWLEPGSADLTGWRFGRAGLSALLDSVVKRPGGWSVPLRATCSGHETGAVFQLRADGPVGAGVQVRVHRLSPVTVPFDVERAGGALLLTCRECSRPRWWDEGTATEAMVRALVAWKTAGGVGRVRFKWS
jgi:hypothetical protein